MRAILGWAAANVVGLSVFVLLVKVVGWATGKATASFSESVFVLGILIGPTAVVTAPMLLASSLIIRASGIRRPWADTVAGVAIAMLTACVPMLILPGGAFAESGIFGLALICGLAAGPTYWYVAGKPRPPYD